MSAEDEKLIGQGFKEAKSVVRSSQGKTNVTVTLTADDGTTSKISAHTFSDGIADTCRHARRQALANLASLLEERE